MLSRCAALILCVIGVTLVAADGHTADDFQCPLCVSFVQRMATTRNELEACVDERFGQEACRIVLPRYRLSKNRRAVHDTFAKKAGVISYEDGLSLCRQMTLCPAAPVPMKSPDASGAWDVRVTPVMMSRSNYAQVRITVIDNQNTTHGAGFLNAFQYNAPFEHSWTSKTVHTGLFSVNPGATSNVQLGDELTVPVRLPSSGAGLRAIIFGDPCFSSQYVKCEKGTDYSILQNVPMLLNLLANHSGAESKLDLWGIVGDNFYDAHGTLGPLWWSQLSMKVKATPFVTLLGNHDYWQHGTPTAAGYDDWGNGFIQYYAMDTVAAVTGSSPFDLSHDPTTGTKQAKQVAVTNTISYSMVGNVAFITFSGANSRKETEAHFQDACKWVGTNSPSWVFVLGHWSAVDMGCEKTMDTKEVHAYVLTLPGCAAIADNIKWIEGHKHCNQILSPQTGFLLGGMGMDPHSCQNSFGIPFIDSHDQRLELLYFPLATTGSVTKAQVDANWQTLFDCVNAQGGLHLCKHLAQVWLNQSFAGNSSSSSGSASSSSSIGGHASSSSIGDSHYW